jgi:hypothetical protein
MKNLYLTFFAVSIATVLWGQNPASLSGGGNLNNGTFSLINKQKVDILKNMGVKMARISLYPGDYWDENLKKAVPQKLDSLILYMAKNGIKALVLFEYYGNYPSLGSPLGKYSKWFDIGKAFAARFSKGSAFFTSNGYANYGISYYSAINEPDISGYAIPKTIIDGAENYHDALEGLADGSHSIDMSLKVIPGGFATENAYSNHTLAGYGTAIADLWNNGKLAGIDLHTYNDARYAPIVRWDGYKTKYFMPQTDFEEVKASCGITRDIGFFCSEYGFKANTQGISDSMSAKRHLTCIWANLGVVGNDNATSATEYALVWNIFNTVEADSVYGMCDTFTPFAPNLKGKTYQLVMNLSKDMNFTKLDPRDRGEFILESPTRKMWVFQNIQTLSSIYGSSYLVNQIPTNVKNLKVYNWKGLLKTIPVSNVSQYLITDLPQTETVMIVAEIEVTTAYEDIVNASINQSFLFPNPAQDYITVEANKFRTIHIYDARGNKVMNQAISEAKVNISQLVDGLYVAEMVDANGVLTRSKLIIKK